MLHATRSLIMAGRHPSSLAWSHAEGRALSSGFMTFEWPFCLAGDGTTHSPLNHESVGLDKDALMPCFLHGIKSGMPAWRWEGAERWHHFCVAAGG